MYTSDELHLYIYLLPSIFTYSSPLEVTYLLKLCHENVPDTNLGVIVPKKAIRNDSAHRRVGQIDKVSAGADAGFEMAATLAPL